MKIYILRHEDRTQDCSFFAPLTKKGLENSINLINILEKENINKIYCSPFIRTLQTIYPYSKQHKMKINIEYGLSELHHQDIISKKAVGISLPEYLAKDFNYNPNYKTIIKSYEIVYPEKENDIIKRVKQVLKQIIKENINTQNNIVLVTHQAFCINTLKIVNDHSSKIKKTLDENTLTNYDKGNLCLIFDIDHLGWIYKPIN
jgi:2,3-bisphosphoglycerate-dependent phosphoglycerate mutase